MTKEGEQFWRDLYWQLKMRGDYTMNQLKEHPEKFDLGRSIQNGDVAPFLNDETRNALGGFVNSIAPMDKILGGAAQGKPLTVLQGGGQMLGAAGVAGAISPSAATGVSSLPKTKYVSDIRMGAGQQPYAQGALDQGSWLNAMLSKLRNTPPQP